MAEWEEKLGAILNNPQAMSQIMSLAQSLGGKGGEAPAQAAGPDSAGEEWDGADTAGPDTSGAESPSGGEGLDPRLMEMGLRAMAAYQDGDDRRSALLRALRPFVKPQRYARVDKAIQIAKLSKVVRAALEGWKGDGHV